MPSDINHFTPDDWSARFSGDLHNFVLSLAQLQRTADRWYALAYGKSDAEIAALPQMTGWAEADIASVQAACSAMRNLAAIANGTGTQATEYGFIDTMSFFV